MATRGHKGAGKVATWLYCSDLHGDHQDPETVQALYEFVQEFKPEHRVFGGDLFDFRAMRKGATKAEQADSMEADVWAGMEFLERFKPTVFLRGNHDERIWQAAAYSSNGIIQDAAKQGVRDIEKKCKKIGCKMLPYCATTGIYKLHGLRFIHGYHAGIYATKKHAEVYAPEGGLVLHGHTHAIQYASISRLNGGAAMGVGCLATVDMEYNKAQTGRLVHRNGWAYGVVWAGGHKAFQAERKGGRWVIASQIKVL